MSSFIFLFFTNCYKDDKSKEDNVGEAFNRHIKIKKSEKKI
jgi:hypothetical protein